MATKNCRPATNDRRSTDAADRSEALDWVDHETQRDSPFFLHTVDVISDDDLQSIYAVHQQQQPIATLADNNRKSSRYFLFDDDGLCGHGNDDRPGLCAKLGGRLAHSGR